MSDDPTSDVPDKNSEPLLAPVAEPVAPKLKRKRPLTKFQRKMAKGLLQGKGPKQAYLDAGGTGHPTKAADRMKQRILVKMPDLMNRIGLKDEALLKKYLKPGLDAMETKFFQKDGIVTDQRDVIAWGPRLQALDMAFNLRGSYAAKPGTRVEVAGDGDYEVVIKTVE